MGLGRVNIRASGEAHWLGDEKAKKPTGSGNSTSVKGWGCIVYVQQVAELTRGEPCRMHGDTHLGR